MSDNAHIFILDIDECADEGGHDCDENANCTNAEGSYTCQCYDGYDGSGKECYGIIQLQNCNRKLSGPVGDFFMRVS